MSERGGRVEEEGPSAGLVGQTRESAAHRNSHFAGRRLVEGGGGARGGEYVGFGYSSPPVQSRRAAVHYV